MFLLVKDIIKAMEILAPPFLKEDYDNVGLMVGDENKEVKRVLLALDCTKKVIEEAKFKNVDLIITHHPLLFKKPSSIVKQELQGEKIIELIKNNISLYSSHTNLDVVSGGINDEIVKFLGFNNSEIIEKIDCKAYLSAGIGRMVRLNKKMTTEQIVSLVKEKLDIDNVRVVVGTNEINKIAIINGSGQDYFKKAIDAGCNCIITGDTTYHYVSDCKEMGITVIDAGHFNTEWLIFLKVMKKIEDKFAGITFYHSDVSKDPYEIY